MKQVFALCVLVLLSTMAYCQELASSSAFVVDLSNNQILLSKQSNAVRPIASLTKLMTAIVALDAADNMDDVIEITNEDANHAMLHGYQMSKTLPVGTKLTRKQLLLVMLCNSQNRAAVAIARSSKYGYQGFIDQMNQHATDMGLINTKFLEPSGLSSDNVSTAMELTIIAKKALSYSDIKEFSTTRSTTVVGVAKHFNSTNFMTSMPSWQLFLQKTGFTNPAGKCMITITSIKNRIVATVLLNAPSTKSRFADMVKIKTIVADRTKESYVQLQDFRTS